MPALAGSNFLYKQNLSQLKLTMMMVMKLFIIFHMEIL